MVGAPLDQRHIELAYGPREDTGLYLVSHHALSYLPAADPHVIYFPTWLSLAPAPGRPVSAHSTRARQFRLRHGSVHVHVPYHRHGLTLLLGLSQYPTTYPSCPPGLPLYRFPHLIISIIHRTSYIFTSSSRHCSEGSRSHRLRQPYGYLPLCCGRHIIVRAPSRTFSRWATRVSLFASGTRRVQSFLSGTVMFFHHYPNVFTSPLLFGVVFTFIVHCIPSCKNTV